MLIEHSFNCPYCDAPISVLLDLSEPAQDYIEDCEVCCQPMGIRCCSEAMQLTEFIARRVDD